MENDFLDLIRQSQLSPLRLRLVFAATERVSLPPFLGSTLRGAFGAAFKAQSCRRTETECERRCADPACRYGSVFEPRRQTAKGGIEELPPAYVIRSLPATAGRALETGDVFHFELLLFGPAVHSALAIREAFFLAGQGGLGVRRVPFLLPRSEVWTENDEWRFPPFTDADERTLAAAAVPLFETVSRRLSAFTTSDALQMSFLTPLRIRAAGKFREDLPFPIIVRAAANRIDELARAYGAPAGLMNRVAERDWTTVRTERDALRVTDRERHSNRQETKMRLGGLTGDIRYRGTGVRDALPLLIAGEAMHVGSSTSFGLGLYQLSSA
jgi:hypothetical protein